METIRLFILKIILSSILNMVFATSNKNTKSYNYLQSNDGMEQKMDIEKTGRHKFEPERTTRSVYKRNWSKSHHGNYNIPPYLVFNRQTGSYYPYYTYPKENSIRRNGFKHSKKWSH